MQSSALDFNPELLDIRGSPIACLMSRGFLPFPVELDADREVV